MKVYGLWWGGVNYSMPEYADVEQFSSIDRARRALLDRANKGDRWETEFFYTHWVDRPSHDQWAYTPNADCGAMITLYHTDPSQDHDPIPFRILQLNDRGQIHVERV